MNDGEIQPAPQQQGAVVSRSMIEQHDCRAEKIKRTRVSNPKVRTGCVTCKIRRVKCDETKPACDRCTKTGRTCDGYAEPPPRRKVAIVPASRSLQYMTGTTSELNALSFFYNHTAPKLSSYFDGDFWSRMIFQMSHAEISVKHAMIAVGVLDSLREGRNRLLETQVVIPDESSAMGPVVKKSATCDEPFAIKAYNKAVGALAEHIRSSNVSVEVVLLACILFVYVEILRGDIDLCLRHIHNGTSIALSTIAGEGPAGSLATQRIKKGLLPFFNRLELLSMFFGDQPKWEYPVRLTQAVPERFDTLTEARDSIVHVMNAIYRFVRNMKFKKYDKLLLPDDLARQAALRREGGTWKATFDRFLVSDHLTERDRHIGRILDLHHLISMIWLDIGVAREECHSDALFDQFGEAVRMMEAIYGFADMRRRRETVLPNFLFDMEIVSPLYLAAVRCRHPVIRRRALNILKRSMRREGLWDSRAASVVAERCIAIEEADLTVFDGSELPTEAKRIHTLHLQTVSSMKHIITFYAKPQGLDGPWRIWQEDAFVDQDAFGWIPRLTVPRRLRTSANTIVTPIAQNHPYMYRKVPPHNHYDSDETLDQLLNNAEVEAIGFEGSVLLSKKPPKQEQ